MKKWELLEVLDYYCLPPFSSANALKMQHNMGFFSTESENVKERFCCLVISLTQMAVENG